MNIEDYIQRFQDGGSPGLGPDLTEDDPLFIREDLPETPDAKAARRAGLFKTTKEEVSGLFETIDRMSAMRDAEDRKKIIPLQQRLDEATPYERDLYETTGLEPGLTRPSLLPYGPRFDAQGNPIRGSSGFKLPELLAGTIRAGMAPGAALRGVEIGEEEGQQLAMELAMETMGGSMVPGVPVNPGDFIAGMAVRPKGGVFRPTPPKNDPFSESYNELDVSSSRFIGSNLDPDMSRGGGGGGAEHIPLHYAKLLIDAGMDEEIAMGIAQRSENFFKRRFGTYDDPLKIRILEGKVDPMLDAGMYSDATSPRLPYVEELNTLRFPKTLVLKDVDAPSSITTGGVPVPSRGFQTKDAQFQIGKENLGFNKLYDPEYDDHALRLTPELLAQARADHAANLNNPNPVITPALEKFELLYDMGTGLNQSGFKSDLSGAFNEMYKEGVPVSMMNPVLPEFVDQYSSSPNAEQFNTGMRGLMDMPAARVALEQGQPVYDINALRMDKGPLGILKPERIAKNLGRFPNADSLRNMSFPDIISTSERIGARYDDLDAAVSRARSGKRSSGSVPPSLLLERGVEKVLNQGDQAWFKITDAYFTELEGAMMGHSVGGYAVYDTPSKQYNTLGGRAALEDGSAQIFSLRNQVTGKPKITVEMDFRNPDRPKPTHQIQGFKNAKPAASDLVEVYQLLDSLHVFPEDMPGRLPEISAGYEKYMASKANRIVDSSGETVGIRDLSDELRSEIVGMEEQVIQRRIERNRRIGQVAQESRQARAEREGLERAEQREVTAERAPRRAVGPNGETGFINPVTGEFTPDVV